MRRPPRGRRPLVFVPNKAGHDFSEAEKYGELVFLTQGTINPYKANSIYRRCVDVMNHAHIEDYLLISSLNIITSIASGVLAHRFGMINYLLFCNDRYLVRTVDFASLAEQEVE